jgi:hypothetical protein
MFSSSQVIAQVPDAQLALDIKQIETRPLHSAWAALAGIE